MTLLEKLLIEEHPVVLKFSDFPCSPHVLQALEACTTVVSLSREALLGRAQPLPGVVGLLPLITDKVDAELIDLLPDLRGIANYGAGVDNLDVEAATRQNIQVTNTPGVLSDAVAELTWGLILAASRRIVESDATVRRGGFTGWTPTFQLGMELAGKTLGIFGLGQIGEAVAERAVGFKMRVLYTRRRRLSAEREAALGITYATFETLVQESDVISLHAPLTPETHHCFHGEVFAQMRPNAVLINTSRGALIDEAALAEALQNGPLMAAGLDVYEAEPKVHPALLGLQNVVLTAHIGSATEETRRRMGDLALENMRAILQGKPPLNPVNCLPV